MKHPKDYYLITITDLLELFNLYKIKIFIFILISILLGIFYTYNQESVSKKIVKIHISHPLIDDDYFIENSGSLRKILDESELNKKKYPNLTWDTKNKVFTFINIGNDDDILEKIFLDSLDEYVESMKNISKISIPKNNNTNPNIISSIPVWFWLDLSSMDSDQVKNTLHISTSENKILHPNPLKYIVIGIFISLALTNLFLIINIIINKYFS